VFCSFLIDFDSKLKTTNLIMTTQNATIALVAFLAIFSAARATYEFDEDWTTEITGPWTTATVNATIHLSRVGNQVIMTFPDVKAMSIAQGVTITFSSAMKFQDCWTPLFTPLQTTIGVASNGYTFSDGCILIASDKTVTVMWGDPYAGCAPFPGSSDEGIVKSPVVYTAVNMTCF
jgi:hypothetical protein